MTIYEELLINLLFYLKFYQSLKIEEITMLSIYTQGCPNLASNCGAIASQPAGKRSRH